MKRILLGIIIGIAAGGIVAWSFLKSHGAPEAKAEKKEEHKEESHVQKGTNGETILKFDQAAQDKMSLKVVELESSELKPELKAFGRVLDLAPLSAELSDIALANSQLEASTREFERVKTLFGQNQNVSARTVETAQAAVQRDRLTIEAAQLRLTSTWGKAIAGMDGLNEFVRAAIAQNAALVRLDVPAGENLKGTPVSARIALLSTPDMPIPATFLGSAVSVDPQSQGRGFLFAVKTNGIAAGASVIGWLTLPGEPESGVIVPRDAIVRHEGEAFVYIRRNGETFERKEMELAHPLEQGWFTDDLKPKTMVVVNGAQQLLSEELKGEGGE